MGRRHPCLASKTSAFRQTWAIPHAVPHSIPGAVPRATMHVIMYIITYAISYAVLFAVLALWVGVNIQCHTAEAACKVPSHKRHRRREFSSNMSDSNSSRWWWKHFSILGHFLVLTIKESWAFSRGLRVFNIGPCYCKQIELTVHVRRLSSWSGHRFKHSSVRRMHILWKHIDMKTLYVAHNDTAGRPRNKTNRFWFYNHSPRVPSYNIYNSDIQRSGCSFRLGHI